MIDFDRLLDLQAHDTTADQVRHRRATLAERDELVSIAAEADRLAAARDDAAERRAELAREEKRFEDEAQSVESKASSERDRLYDGSVTAPKELQAIQVEIDGLRRRQSELEDEALALMERIEPIDAELAEIDRRLDDLGQRRAEATARLQAGEAEADDELATVVAERAELAAGLDPAVLATYEEVRAAQGGVAVCRLVGSTCEGCHLGLSAVELDRVKHAGADELVYHDECGRILVR